MLPMSASSTPSLPELTAKVTARSISLADADGVRVTRLEPGSYRIVVKDLTKAQNFHLIGPSVNRRTKVPAKVTTSWTVRLPLGTYTYRSDKNATMSATFTVRPGPPPA
jgi:predicted membrane-bound mannosyltransferase